MNHKDIEKDMVENGFDQEGKCYIHIENDDVNHVGYTIFSGDIMMCMIAVNRLINKIAIKVGDTYENSVDLLNTIQKFYGPKTNVGRGKYKKLDNIEKIKIIEVTEKLEAKEKEVEILKKEKHSLEFKLKLKKEEDERKIDALKKENEDLKKKVLELDHENQRLVDLYGL